MNLYRRMFAVVAGLGLLSAGCLSAADDMSAEAIDALPSDVLTDPNTHTGSNSLNHIAFRDTKYTLNYILTKELLVGANNTLNTEIASLMCGNNSPAGAKDTFKYAMACALPAGYSVSCGDYTTPTGHTPILGNTGAWVSNSAGVSASPGVKEEILACVAAHVNAFNDDVDLVLSGEHVNDVDDPAEFGDFVFPEARWTASDSGTAGIIINVWPSQELLDSCPVVLLENIIKARICGIDAPYCYLSFGGDLSECVPAQEDAIGAYTCDDKVAIQTWLTELDMNDIYAACVQ